jgi:hypothetical protein
VVNHLDSVTAADARLDAGFVPAIVDDEMEDVTEGLRPYTVERPGQEAWSTQRAGDDTDSGQVDLLALHAHIW